MDLIGNAKAGKNSESHWLDKAELFQGIKPSGTALILNSEESSLLELLRLTFLNLLLVKVIEVDVEIRKAHPRDRWATKYYTVKKGDNYYDYKPFEYEVFFLQEVKGKTKVRLRKYLQEVYSEIPSGYRHKKQVISNLGIEQYFKSSFKTNLFRKIEVNLSGSQLKEGMSSLIDRLDEELETLINIAPEKALKALVLLKGNVFLLRKTDFKILARIDRKFEQNEISNLTVSDSLWSDFLFDLDFSMASILSDMDGFFKKLDVNFGPDTSPDWGDL